MNGCGGVLSVSGFLPKGEKIENPWLRPKHSQQQSAKKQKQTQSVMPKAANNSSRIRKFFATSDELEANLNDDSFGILQEK